MGQKVSPVGLRIGINKDWESKWYAPNKDFAKYLNTDIKIREYLEKNLKGSSVASIVIERNNKRTNIIINTSKPGVVIGRGGEEIEKHKKALAKLTGEDIYISIVEIKQPDLNAALVAEQIAMQIENRVSFRVAQKKAIRNTMKAGAKGIKTLISGRLNGAEIARSEGYNEGTVPLHTLRADIDYAHKEADNIYGKIGDTPVMIDTSRGGKTVILADKNLYFYRIHPNQDSRNASNGPLRTEIVNRNLLFKGILANGTFWHKAAYLISYAEWLARHIRFAGANESEKRAFLKSLTQAESAGAMSKIYSVAGIGELVRGLVRILRMSRFIIWRPEKF